MTKTLKGLHTALISPFNQDQSLDIEGLKLLIERQLETGVSGITLLGTTAESPTLTENEKTKIISIGRELINTQTIMMVGTGSNSTATTIKNTQEAESLGADMALVVVPYYNRPSEEGLFLHFKTVASNTALPIVLYNVPGRCGQNLSLNTLKRLLDIPNIIGIKEASGHISQIIDVISAVKDYRPGFSVMSGDDALTLPLMALGASGVVSVLSNLLPNEMKLLVETIEEGDFDGARKIHNHLSGMFKAEFIESNPAPIKAAMNLLGLPAGSCRLPLADLTKESDAVIRQALEPFINVLR